ncbi:MAG: energy transducer TonB [Chitinophagaceae bacterium]|nr:energy transducer TonB [Chitinophagaceae bacterium]
MKNLLILLPLFVSCALSAQQVDTFKNNIPPADSVFQKVEIEAYFPGGEQMWNKYIQGEIEKEMNKLLRDKKSNGTCEIRFIVDKDGSTTAVEALSLKGSLLSKIFIRAIKNCPKWVPAYQFGKTVKAWRLQKITFRIP